MKKGGIPLFEDPPPPPAPKPPDTDWLMQSLYDFLRKNYQPTTEKEAGNADQVEYLTTLELYEKLQHIYPDPPEGPNALAHWLHQEGFTYTLTDQKIYWLLKKKA